MPDTRGTHGFGAGFAQTSNARSRRMDAESVQERNRMLKRAQTRKELEANIEDAIKSTSDLVTQFTPIIFSSEGKDRDSAITALKTGRGSLFDSTSELLNSAVAEGFMTVEEARVASHRVAVAGKETDPRAAQDLAARGAGGLAQAKAEGELPSQLALERQRAITRGTPTSQNINQITEQVNQQPTGEVEGIGRDIMADVQQSTGIVAGISKGLSSIFGQFVPGTNQRLDAAQRIKNFNQEIKFALSRNPKYPVAEMKAIQKEMLIDADAWIVDPEAEARKIIIMKDSLEKWNEADRIALPSLTNDKAQEALERIGTRKTMIDLIGDVPSLDESNNEEIESLQEKVMDGTATDEENRRFIELNSQ